MKQICFFEDLETKININKAEVIDHNHELK